MNSLTSSQSISSRKTELCNLISQAMEVNDEELLFFLEGQWVHRYGLEGFKDYGQLIDKSTTPEHSQADLLREEECHYKLVELPEEINSIPTDLKQIDQKESITLEEDSTASSTACSIGSIGNDLNLDDLTSRDEIEDQYNARDMESSEMITTPPPAPSISHLRRWLPLRADGISKAS